MKWYHWIIVFAPAVVLLIGFLVAEASVSRQSRKPKGYVGKKTVR